MSPFRDYVNSFGSKSYKIIDFHLVQGEMFYEILWQGLRTTIEPFEVASLDLMEVIDFLDYEPDWIVCYLFMADPRLKPIYAPYLEQRLEKYYKEDGDIIQGA